MVLLRSSPFAIVLAGLVNAATVKRQTITPLSTTQIASFNPFTHFASTAYCNPSTTINWSCGANCQANPDFMPVSSGGDGNGVQFWYVGFSQSQNTVIVAHQGTNFNDVLAILTDTNFFLAPLDSTLFPGIPSSVQAHEGFASEQAKTATTILSHVQQTITAHKTSTVTIVGHSLGAALSLLDGVYLRLHLSTNITVRVIGYGMPRVGNQDFANWVDSHLGGHVTHINNKEDPVPTLPGRFLGFHHCSGEIHIIDSNAWENCPGQDNPSSECVVGDLRNIFRINPNNHLGPYNGITMGC